MKQNIKQKPLTPYQKTVRELSERIVKAQQPIRVLDGIKWGADIQQDFFDHNCSKLPAVTKEYYEKNPLPYNPEELCAEFYHIERDIKRLLGQFSTVGNIMQRMCREYRE